MIPQRKPKLKFIQEVLYLFEFEALEDSSVVTDCGDHPAFNEDAKHMILFVRKGERIQLREMYLKPNNLTLSPKPSDGGKKR